MARWLLLDSSEKQQLEDYDLILVGLLAQLGFSPGDTKIQSEIDALHRRIDAYILHLADKYAPHSQHN